MAKEETIPTHPTSRLGGVSVRGLSQIRNAAGRLSYVLNVTSPGRPRQTLRLGDAHTMSLEEAQSKALRIQRELFKKNTQSYDFTQPLVDLTFSDFLRDHYLPYVIAKQRSTAAAESYLRNWVEPILGSKRIDDIKKRDILFLVRSAELAGLKPGSVNRVLNIVKSCFSKAIEWELTSLSESPAKGVAELVDPAVKERFLSQGEASELIRIVKSSRNPMLFLIVGFLLMTGARRSEALLARWEHIDIARETWLIPFSKSGKPRHIPLSAGAISFLAEAKKISSYYPLARTSPYVFPNRKTGEPFSNIFNSWDTARKKAGLKDVRMHDLRHSFASALVNNGLSIYDVKELLGHSSVSTTQRYAHLSQDRLSKAANTVSDHFDVAPETSKGTK